jgi:hypothetical protein
MKRNNKNKQINMAPSKSSTAALCVLESSRFHSNGLMEAAPLQKTKMHQQNYGDPKPPVEQLHLQHSKCTPVLGCAH